MSRQCSLKDIAIECGLSVSTVSQILKNSSRDYSSEETRRKVRETARRLGYKKNYGYQLMHGQKTMTVALMASMEFMRAEEHVSRLVIELMACFDLHGYASYFNTFVDDAQQNLNKVRDLMARGVECFVMIGAPVGHQNLEETIRDNGGYVISSSEELTNHIFIGDLEASRRLVNYLCAKSDDRLCYISLNHLHGGRFDALCEHFPELHPEEVIRNYTCDSAKFGCSGRDYAESAFRAGFTATEYWLSQRPETRAFFYMNDNLAQGGVAYLIQKGMKIGVDAWVAGYNNDIAIRNAPYPISSADHDWEKNAPLFVEKALKHETCQLKLDAAVHIREYIPGTLQIREITDNS